MEYTKMRMMKHLIYVTNQFLVVGASAGKGTTSVEVSVDK